MGHRRHVLDLLPRVYHAWPIFLF